MAKFPTYKQMAKDVAEIALDEYLISGKTLREWVKIIIEQEVCEDCISREKALEKFCDYVGAGMSMNDFDALYDIIAKMPSVKPEAKWIPVSERLPEEKYYCLCCDKDGYITIGYLSVWSKQWCFEDDEVDIDVIAWMPLPEPYKESEG